MLVLLVQPDVVSASISTSKKANGFAEFEEERH